MEINFDDNFLEKKEHKIIEEYCLTASYTYGEVDMTDSVPTGMIHEIPESEFVYKLLRKKILEKCEFVGSMNLYRMYINCFSPSENPYYHTDGEEDHLTFLYYPNNEWQLNDGGETQFFIDGDIYGVAPIPNRIVMFNGSLMHRATSFRDRYRFTIAIKYK